MTVTISVGRIVHYYDKHIVGDNADGPYAAIVTKVFGPAMVNLDVFGVGAPYIATSVPEGTADSGSSRWWQWPPKV